MVRDFGMDEEAYLYNLLTFVTINLNNKHYVNNE